MMETIVIKSDLKKAKAIKQFLKAFGISFKSITSENEIYNQDFLNKILNTKDEKSSRINPDNLWGSIS